MKRESFIPSESKSWNPVLEIFETAHALTRHMGNKKRDVTHEAQDAQDANQKFRQHHNGEIISVIINDVLYLVKGSEDDGLQRHELPHKGDYEGFVSVTKNGKIDWFIELSGDEGILIPVGELRSTAQIISFKPKKR